MARCVSIAARSRAWFVFATLPLIAPALDLASDRWTATDGLGRVLPEAPVVRVPRADATVGIFYFLWLGEHGSEQHRDIGRIFAEHPDARDNPQHPAWGPVGSQHWWGEPAVGYYHSTNETVLRLHARQLAAAGVDTLIFDTSNTFTYQPSWQALGRAFSAERALGNPTPQFCFLTPFGDPKTTVRELYETLYKPGHFRDLWFLWDGKPLILANPDKVEPELRDFFTFRAPQPDYFQGPTRSNQWSWLEVHPQHGFNPDANGRPEQVSVGVAQNAVEGRLGVMSNPKAYGRSFHGGQVPPPAGYDFTGRNCAEQWKRALELDPRFLFITGWNEWTAGRFEQGAQFHGMSPLTFVDTFDQEHSRDIEPMKGGHGDAYYWQMIDGIRRFKGARPPPRLAPGDTAEFRDFAGDAEAAEDVTRITATRRGNALEFAIETRAPATGTNWSLVTSTPGVTETASRDGRVFLTWRSASGTLPASLDSQIRSPTDEAPDGRWRYRLMLPAR